MARKLYWFFFAFIAMRAVYRSDYILRANLDILIICFGNFSPLLSSLGLAAPNQRFSNWIENDYSSNVETSWQKSNGHN